MESTRSEKQEGTHGGCCGCDVAHCGTPTPSKHPSSSASQNNTVIEEWKGCFGKEEPHSSLHCLFVLLVAHGVVFPMPLLSVGGASLQMAAPRLSCTTQPSCVFCDFEGQES